MAAPVKPESAPSGTPGTKIPTAEELASRQTPPTNQPTDPPTDGKPESELTREQRIIAAQDAALRDANRKNIELGQRLRGIEDRVGKVEKGPEPSPEDMNQDFWKNPTGVLGTLIQKELATTVAPINERLNKLSQGQNLSAYDQMKVKLKNEYSDIWDKIEPSIDQWARGAQEGGQEVSEQMLSIAALTASGAYYRGQLPDQFGERPAPAAPPKQPAPPNPAPGDPKLASPPHLRPSAPPPPSNDQPAKKELRTLTENEARLARERGQTAEQYLAWLDVPPEQVVHSQLGRPEKKA